MKNNNSGLLYVDSRRRNYGTSNDFSISWSEDIEMDAVGLLSVVMPNTIYNVNSTNNSITITEGATTKTVSVPAGIYNIAGLLTVLGTELTNDGTLTGTYSLTLDPTTQKVVASCSTNFTIVPDSDGDGLATSLGFTVAQAQASSRTANQLYDISGERSVYIQLDLPLSSRFNNERRDIIGVVPIVEAEFGGIISKSYESSEQMIYFADRQFINSLNVRLIDGKGRLVDLNGVEWSFELSFQRSDTE